MSAGKPVSVDGYLVELLKNDRAFFVEWLRLLNMYHDQYDAN